MSGRLAAADHSMTALLGSEPPGAAVGLTGCSQYFSYSHYTGSRTRARLERGGAGGAGLVPDSHSAV